MRPLDMVEGKSGGSPGNTRNEGVKWIHNKMVKVITVNLMFSLVFLSLLLEARVLIPTKSKFLGSVDSLEDN